VMRAWRTALTMLLIAILRFLEAVARMLVLLAHVRVSALVEHHELVRVAVLSHHLLQTRRVSVLDWVHYVVVVVVTHLLLRLLIVGKIEATGRFVSPTDPVPRVEAVARLGVQM